MQPIAWLGISPTELDERAGGRVWQRWTEAEQDLSRFSGLHDLHALSGPANDPPLGALARLAAVDGHDDELAAIALAHQLEWGARSLMHGLRELSDDIDQMVMGALWVRIRCFPWRQRTRAIAANILRDTRADVLCQLTQPRCSGSGGPCVPVDPQSWVLDRATALDDPATLTPGTTGDQAIRELVDVLDWALTSRIIRRDDLVLLLDLVAAGQHVSEQETPWMKRGVCSQAAVAAVAAQRGVCGKTIRRRRDRIVSTLRAASGQYLADVA